jgi:hypothetical protein
MAMFSTFLNKEDFHCLDLSVFINCNPERTLFYFYNSFIRINLETYHQMKEWVQIEDSPKSCLNQWLELLETGVGSRDDLIILQENEYLNEIGPYYYGPTNTRFYFYKLSALSNEPLTSVDFAVLFNLNKSPAIDKKLQKYYKTRKTNKKITRSREDLVTDLDMCLDALQQIERITRHCDYLNMLLEQRHELLLQEDLLPAEPEAMISKPEKPEEPQLTFSSLLAINQSKKRQLEYVKACGEYNRRMKIYLIRYREHEKACDRFKIALQDWEENHLLLAEKCIEQIEEAQAKLKTAQGLLEIYQFILDKSYIHKNYHHINIISTCKNYLDTGRANDLQDCMNLYEEERHWREIKASQERIENTIYFLQAEIDSPAFAETSHLIASTMDAQ